MRSVFKSVILTIREILLRIISLLLFHPKCTFSDDQIQRILIIRIDGIGDMVLSIPAIKALRNRFPSAHIAVMTLESTSDLLLGAAYIDEVIIYHQGMSLAELRFDLVFDFLDNYPLKTAFMTYSVKAKYRAGFDIKGRGVFFNLKAPQQNVNNHYMDVMLDLVTLVGAKGNDHALELKASSSAQNDTNQFLCGNNIRENDQVVCIHPGAINWTGRWLPERFAQLADTLIQKQRAKVLFVGAEYDRGLIDQIKSKMTQEPLIYVGHPLRNVVALIQRSNILVCNNSGLLHVACALKTPTVSTMGPALHKKWWPVGSRNIVLRHNLPCIGCGKGYCRIKTHDCMKKITVEEMLEAVQNQLHN